MTDSHAHLSFPEIKDSIVKILDEFIESGGKHVLNVGHTPQSNIEILNQYSLLNERYRGVVLNSVGIHPEYISEILSEGIDRYRQIAKEIQSLKELVKTHSDYISAIGECGLDYHHLKINKALSNADVQENIEQQKHIFSEQIQIAVKYSLPLTIHTRDIDGDNECIEDTLKIVSDVGKGSAKGSFHSYTQNQSYIPEILGLGFYIGVNGIVTYPKAENVREIAKQIPMDRILLETDTPLLPPQLVRRNRKFWRSFGAPSDIKEIAQTIMEVKGISYEEVIKQTGENFKNLFFIN
jgi:TatD DNase family protein